MTTSSPVRHPDPTRTGAVWVTGTGAFLLLAAAAVFTAVRWDQIPAEAKLATLGLATGGFLLAGRRLAASIPATAGALFHLGTFLVPLDVAAIGVHQGWTWPTHLLAQGLAGTVVLGWAATVERSVVLSWAWAGAVVALAAGIGATTPLPAPLVLAAFGVAAVASRLQSAALAWAGVAGLAPVAALVGPHLTTGRGSLADLGLAPAEHPVASAVAALVAAATIAVIGRRRDQVDLVLIGAVVGAAGVGAAWFGRDPGPASSAVALAGTFLAVQLVAMALRTDPFWTRPADVVARVGEALAACGTAGLGIATLVRGTAGMAWGDLEGVPALGLSAGLLGAGWILADRRRGPVGLTWAATAVGTSVVAAVALGTASPIATAVALTAVAVAAAVTIRSDSGLVVVTAASAAPLVASQVVPLAVALGAVGAVAVAHVAVRRSTQAPAEGGPGGRAAEESAWLLSLTALAPLATALGAALAHEVPVAPALVAAAVAATALAAFLDRGTTTGDLPLGTLGRAGAVAVLAGVGALPPHQIALVGLVVAALSVGDAIRLRLPQLALGASVAVPVVVGAFVHGTGLSLPSTGVALTVAAVVMAGIGFLLGTRWLLPTGVAVALATGAGLLLATDDPRAFADALMVGGGLALAGTSWVRRTDLMVAAGLVVTTGFWMRLGAAEVSASEPYLVPVVALLLLAGARTRTGSGEAPSSWIAYGPAIGLLGGAALAERIEGGPGWHAVLTGVVGVVSVAVGGQRRLAAPLVLGTALLVALVGYETLDVTATLPTWIWLALGGTALLSAGVAMERHELGPVESGRRLVDVVSDNFT